MGIKYYYCVVTNTNNSVSGAETATATSNVAAITVNALVDAQTPSITGTLENATYDQGETATALAVSASVGDGGTLSYKWYENNENSTENGTVVGTNSASYTPDTRTVGIKYYYCVVTNTNQGVSGTKTATATSNVAAITVYLAPTVGTIIAPAAVTAGQQLALTIPTMNDNGTIVTDQGWEISVNGTSDWTAFDPATSMSLTHNGQYLRYFATSSVGTGYSNIIQITVNSSGSKSSSRSSNKSTWNWTFDKAEKPSFGTLNLSNEPSASGSLSTGITKQMVQSALDKANSSDIALELQFGTAKDINDVNITFDADTLVLLESSDVKEVSIVTKELKLGLDRAAIREISKQINTAVTVSASREDKLSDAASKMIRDNTAWDIVINYKKSGEVKTITNFGSGSMTRAIKYTPLSSDKTEYLAMVRVGADGKPSWMEDSGYKDGWVIGTGNTFSIYGIGYKTPVTNFTDTAVHWAKNDIEFVANRGLIIGTTETTFSPNAAITRADFLMALGKLSGVDVSEYKQSSFKDVSKDSLAMPYIEWAADKGIVQGIGSNKFAPSNTITREQMAVMMVNYVKATGHRLPVSQEEKNFSDNTKISTWAASAVKAIQLADIMNGKNDNLFDPSGSATRAESSVILHRFVEFVIEKESARN